MDKIKLFSADKKQFPKNIIDNEFEFLGSSYDYLRHNHRLRYANDKVKLNIDKYGLQIITNPTNYLKENNLLQLTRAELIEFKNIFESDLHTNTNTFRLTGFDYNVNIMTDFPVSSYLRSFDILPKYKKEIYSGGHGITYINACKSFSIYDKKIQMKETFPIHHFGLMSANIMRLELGVMSRVSLTKNLSSIHTLEDLTVQHNYIQMINEYENIYNKIHKQPLHKFQTMTKPHPSQMMISNFTLVYYINEIGMDNFIYQLEQERAMGLLSYKQYKTRKDKAMLLWEAYGKIDVDKIDLFTEMNTKVINKINENRNRVG